VEVRDGLGHGMIAAHASIKTSHWIHVNGGRRVALTRRHSWNNHRRYW
jgi:hypothetical protein